MPIEIHFKNFRGYCLNHNLIPNLLLAFRRWIKKKTMITIKKDQNFNLLIMNEFIINYLWSSYAGKNTASTF